MSKITDQVKALVAPVVEQLGYELYDVKYGKENGENVLDIVIDCEDGIGLNDCEGVSRQVEPILDAADPVPGSYMLSVSSPGADRPLRDERDYEKNLDKTIEIRLYRAFEGKNKHIGKLLSYDQDHITILDRNKKITIPRELVSLVKQYVDFN